MQSLNRFFKSMHTMHKRINYHDPYPYINRIVLSKMKIFYFILFYFILSLSFCNPFRSTNGKIEFLENINKYELTLTKQIETQFHNKFFFSFFILMWQRSCVCSIKMLIEQWNKKHHSLSNAVRECSVIGIVFWLS